MRSFGIRKALVVVAAVAGLPLALATASAVWTERSLKIIQATESNFPPTLMAQGVTEGEVRAVLHVGPEGKLQDCLITSYTHPELATELLANVREWRYEPAYQRGEPAHTRVEAVFGFVAKGSVLSISAIDQATTSTLRLLGARPTVLVCKLHELDEPPHRVHVVQPLHPGRSLNPAQPRGSAVVDFYIDAEGRPRMPMVTRASHAAFALAAIAALEQWRFAPPTRAGQPIAVRVSQEFRF